MQRLLALALALPALAGCDGLLDPQNRAGAWRPNGANEQNLRAMVAQPSDLLIGTSATGSDGETAAQAIDRLRNDRVRPLPESSVVRIGAGSQGGTP